MVGVPGRSKGCRTCRRRKKGCDKQVPSCNQCISAGLICGGYGRDLVWVNATTEEPSKRRDPPVQTPWHVRYAGQPDPETQVVLRDSLARTARELKYLGLFWSAYLPNGRAFTPHATKLSTGGWTNVLGRLYDSEPTLRMAALSMSASVLGGQANDQQLKVKGLQSYSRAIEEMSIALNDPIRCKGDGLLAATRLMEFYEILFGSDADQYPEASTHVAGWRGHNDGQMAITLMRGPNSLRSGAGHQLFADGRLNIVVGAIAKRQKSPLSSHEWKTIPWELKEKSSKDKLIDILVEIPGLLEQLDQVRSCQSAEQATMLRGKLLLECRQNHDALVAWEQDMGDDLLAYDYTVQGLPLPEAKADLDVALLQATHLYWCTALLLYSTMGFVMRPPAPPAGVPSPAASDSSQQSSPMSKAPTAVASLPPRPPVSPPSEAGAPSLSLVEHLGLARKNPRSYACKIAYSVHLFWEPSTGAFGNHIGLFPLGLAMRFLAALEPIEHSKEYMVMRALFQRPFLGTFVGRFLSNLQREAPQKHLREMKGDAGIQARASRWWKEGEKIPIRSPNKG